MSNDRPADVNTRPEDGSASRKRDSLRSVSSTPRRRIRVRPTLRALHRDIGYLLVGLTFVYAISGLAVNHIADWDPNFVNFEREHEVALAAGEDEPAIVARVAAALALPDKPIDVYRLDDRNLDIIYDDRTLHVDIGTGHVIEQGQDERFLLRVSNWLHLNRGKKQWTYIADGYAGLLLFLATSGMFMLPGKKGLLGRGAVLVAIGILVPVLYVTLSGGP